MKFGTRATRMAIIGFVVLAVVGNLSIVEAGFERNGNENVVLRIVGLLSAIAFLALAVYVWAAAVAHLRANTQLIGPRRTFWSAIVYGTFVFGAIAYHLQYLRSDRAQSDGDTEQP